MGKEGKPRDCGVIYVKGRGDMVYNVICAYEMGQAVLNNGFDLLAQTSLVTPETAFLGE